MSSTAKLSRLSNEDLLRLWKCLVAAFGRDDSILCKQLFAAQVGSALLTQAIKSVFQEFGPKFTTAEEVISAIRDVCKHKYNEFRTSTVAPPQPPPPARSATRKDGLRPPIPDLRVLMCKVTTTKQFDSDIGPTPHGRRVMTLADGRMFAYVRQLFNCQTGQVELWQKVRKFADGPRVVPGDFVAIKLINKVYLQPGQNLIAENPVRELRVLSFLSSATPRGGGHGHPNICRLIVVARDSERLYAVMEYLPGLQPGQCPWLAQKLIKSMPNMPGELFEVVRHNKGLPESVAKIIFKDILTGTRFIHRNGIAHCDLTLENIMLSGQGVAKLIDFGLCVQFTPHGWTRFKAGKSHYFAPEVFKKKVITVPVSPNDDVRAIATKITAMVNIPTELQMPYCLPIPRDGSIQVPLGRVYHAKPTDVWSLGISLFIMLCGATPWKYASIAMKDKAYHFFCTRGFKALLKAFGARLSPPAIDLLTIILNRDPSARPTVEDLLAHPWVNSVPPRGAPTGAVAAAPAGTAAAAMKPPPGF